MIYYAVYAVSTSHIIVIVTSVFKMLVTAARSGVCRYGRLLYSAPGFFFFFYLTNLRKNGRTLFGAKYGRT